MNKKLEFPTSGLSRENIRSYMLESIEPADIVSGRVVAVKSGEGRDLVSTK